jgi:hypothetical protein
MSHDLKDLQVGKAYRSKRSGRVLTVLALEDDRVYYRVEGFETIVPLFLPRERFLHLVGLADIDGEDAS